MSKKSQSPVNINPRYLTVIGEVVHKIQMGIAHPGLILNDLNIKYRVLRYKLLLIVDPPPRQRGKELTEDYFNRVDPKYGLRFYEAMVSMGGGIDLNYALPYVDEVYGDKKSRDAMKEILIKLVEIHQENLENYKKYQIRSKILG